MATTRVLCYDNDMTGRHPDPEVERLIAAFARTINDIISSEVSRASREPAARSAPPRRAPAPVAATQTRAFVSAKSNISTRVLIAARSHSGANRDEINTSDTCGCFHCLSVLAPADVVAWTDEGRTAVCPRCNVPAVLGSASGYDITPEFIGAMKRHWFGA